MKAKTLLGVLMLLFVCNVSQAQNYNYRTEAVKDIASENILSVGCKVENLTIKDLNGNPAVLPYWGQKNILDILR